MWKKEYLIIRDMPSDTTNDILRKSIERWIADDKVEALLIIKEPDGFFIMARTGDEK